MRLKKSKLIWKPDREYTRMRGGHSQVVRVYSKPCYCVQVDGVHCFVISEREYKQYMSGQS